MRRALLLALTLLPALAWAEAPSLNVSLSAKPGATTCDALTLDGRPSDLPALETAARAAVARDPAVVGVVRADATCAHGDVVKISDVLARAGVTRFTWAANEPPLSAPTPELQTAAAGSNAFALKLYGELRGKKVENLFFSPLSISAALGLVNVGAAGKTAQALDQALVPGLPHEQGTVALAQLVQRYVQSRGDATLEVANRLWSRSGLPILPAYAAALQQHFGAAQESVDFSKPEAARQRINAWVKQQTREKIGELLGRNALDPNTELVLTNAVYFLGTWQHPFDPAKTSDAPFTLPSGEKPSVPFMHQVLKVHGNAADGVQVVELPYGKQGTLAFDLLLPDAAEGITALESKLNPVLLGSLLDGLHAARVTLALPRFSERSQFELRQPLTAMGLGGLFAKPDLSAMTSAKGISISAVVHQAFVDVNEKGTEAAAATAVIGSRSLQRMPDMAVTADHPFLFLIRDTATGGILFLGRVADPRK
jgi:serpin B